MPSSRSHLSTLCPAMPIRDSVSRTNGGIVPRSSATGRPWAAPPPGRPNSKRPPGNPRRLHDRPSKERQPPILFGVDGIGRRADGLARVEFVETTPHVRAVTADQEREVPHEADASLSRLAAGGLPLVPQHPLKVLAVEEFVGMLGAQAADRLGGSLSIRGGPFGPVAAAVLCF